MNIKDLPQNSYKVITPSKATLNIKDLPTGSYKNAVPTAFPKEEPAAVKKSFMERIAYTPYDVGNEKRLPQTIGKTAANQAGSVYNLGRGIVDFLNPVKAGTHIGEAIGGSVLLERDLKAQGQSQQGVKDYVSKLQDKLNEVRTKELSPEQEAFVSKATRVANLERLIKEAGASPQDSSHLEFGKALPGALYKSLTPAAVQKGVEEGQKGGFSEGFHAAIQSIAEDPQQLAPYFLIGKKFVENKLPTVDKAISKVGGAPKQAVKAGVNTIKEPVKNALETKYVNDLYNKYNEVFTQTKSVKKTFDKSITTGKDPAQFGAENGYVVDVQKGKINAQPTIAKVTEEYTAPRAKVLDDLLQAKDKTVSPNQYISLDVIAKQAKKGIEKNPLAKGSGTLSDQMLAIDKVIAELKTQYGEKISDYNLNQVKKAQWAESSSFDLTKPKFMGDVNYQIGKAAKDIIETNNPELAIKRLNGEIGDAADFTRNLRKVDGQSSPRGGKMTNLAGRTIGAIAGGHAGPFGSIAGAITGNYITELMQNNSIAGPLKRSVLENIKPDSSLYAEAQLALHRLQNSPAYPELGVITKQTVKPADLTPKPLNPKGVISVNNYRPELSKFLTKHNVDRVIKILKAKEQAGKSLDITPPLSIKKKPTNS